MLITKEQIEARKAQLQASIERAQADLNAKAGALQDCNFWLAQLEKPEDEKK